MMPSGNASTSSAAEEMAMSMTRLTMVLKPCSGTSLMLMTGTPSRSSRRAQRDHLQQVGHDLDVHELPARAFDELQHPHVLFGRQRHVEMVNRLARADFRRLVDRPEQRQP